MCINFCIWCCYNHQRKRKLNWLILARLSLAAIATYWLTTYLTTSLFSNRQMVANICLEVKKNNCLTHDDDHHHSTSLNPAQLIWCIVEARKPDTNHPFEDDWLVHMQMMHMIQIMRIMLIMHMIEIQTECHFLLNFLRWLSPSIHSYHFLGV